MSDAFFAQPILNSPYEYPGRHWELDKEEQPTTRIIERRRTADLITPMPKPKKRKARTGQIEIVTDEGEGLSDEKQQYELTSTINALRRELDEWREISEPQKWMVTPTTQRLLQHWRNPDFQGLRPFFCQVEAVEAAIWLTEVAPNMGKRGKRFLDHLDAANHSANPGLPRLALKLATGAGKTTVMAMLIAWQAINAARTPGSKKFTKGFLIIAPGITIRDRLRVLQPNDPDSYYQRNGLVPSEMMKDLLQAKIVITNFHAFKRREQLEISKGGRALLQGRTGQEVKTLETEGQMIQRVMPELMHIKNIMVINDEAHHCYREKPDTDETAALKGDEKKEAQKNTEAARLWITGLEMVKKKLGLSRVIDLSATPFFLSGSGYVEGTLFPWTMTDFSLMDAIECGIVKLPRVPITDNIPDAEVPMFRNLWDHIGKKMPKKARGKGKALDPLALPVELQTALEALYGHYKQTFELWQKAGVEVPPCFIVVCNNTATSKLVYDYIAGFEYEPDESGITPPPFEGKFELFRNYNEHGERLARPRTLLIDSEQLESGEGLDKAFKDMAKDEIERFRRERSERGDAQYSDQISDEELLREVMNTVGKKGALGQDIRCVVSVSMLTEGWDTNTVTHVLGVRAFGTQLLCEQVVGRALRRQSYELNEEGLFPVEYADVLGIPFDFTAKPVTAPPQPPRETVQVKAVSPERDHLEIKFPRVMGYRIELPEEQLTADFNEDSRLVLTPELIGPSVTQNQGIIGKGVDLTLVHTGDLRRSALIYHLTERLLLTKFRDPGDAPKLHLFGKLKRIVRQWLDGYLECQGQTYPAQLMYRSIADMACERITAAITHSYLDTRPVMAVLDPYNPVGSTSHVSFVTSKKRRWQTSEDHCHINWAVCDSDWELEFCRVAEAHPKVIAYTRNDGLGLEVPYRLGSEARRYWPDFILRIGEEGREPVNLIVEIKGYRGEDAKDKKNTMDSYWIPGVNNLASFGTWAFAEFANIYEVEAEFAKTVEQALASARTARDAEGVV